MTGQVFLSIFAVMSSLITSQASPRLSLLKTLLAAMYKRVFEWGLMMKGVSQFHLYVFSSFRGLGLMYMFSPLLRSYRLICPYCDSQYTISGFSGSMATQKPSPPQVTYHSSLATPVLFVFLDGPPIELLSCVPPYTL